MKRIILILFTASLLIASSCKKEQVDIMGGTTWSVKEQNPSKVYTITLNSDGTTSLGGTWSIVSGKFTMQKSWTNYTGTATATTITGTWSNTTSTGSFSMTKN